MITFQRPDGKSSSAYLVEPVDPKNAPGVVVIQEWWGLDDEIKNVANRLAKAGYRALVPDLYRGKLALEANEAEHLMNDLNFGDAASQDIRGAVQYLKSTGCNKVAVTGFCMGGALTVLSAGLVPECDGTVVWYGYPPLEYVDASAIKKPMLAHRKAIDDSIHRAVKALPLLLAGDMGCLMNMAGKLRREGSSVEVRHVAEVLAGMTDRPPIAGTAPKGGR